jgi:Domain of unknown function (DUF4159)
MRLRGVGRSPATALCAAAFIVASAVYASAQFGRSRGLDFVGGTGGLAPEAFPDGDFVICRLMYTEVRRFGVGWRTDYPLGERNLSIRFGELTKARVSRASDGSPNHYRVRISDDQLFQCPILMAGDIGSIGLTGPEAARLREYLLKGGFLWVDDMWGPEQWEAWTEEVSKVFPPSEFPIEDVPVSDPVFRSQFLVKAMPQIPNIGYWRGSGGDTSEQQEASAVPVFRAIRDSHGRIMVAITHNTDIADAFEREADDPVFFARFSPTGYALGINILLHALTH